MDKYTPEELAMLTDEERADYEESQDFDEGTTNSVTAAEDDGANTADDKPIVVNDDGGDGGDEAGEGGDEGDDDAEGAQGDGADDNKDDAGTADDGGADDPAGADDDAPAPHPAAVTQLPEDYDDQVAKIATDKDALVAKFDEGDITMAEYHKALDDLNRRERELERLKDRVDYEVRAAVTQWVNVTVARFLDEHPQYRENQKLYELLDAEVQKQQRAGDESNQLDPKHLVNAHKVIAESFPMIFGDAAPKKAATTQKKRDIPKVPTLANVPAADVDRPADGKFAHLDRLAETDPLKFESELEKLSDAERDEYLASP